MGKRLLYLFALVFLAAALLQFFLGNPDPGIFAFPVNAVMLLALVGGLYVLYREKAKSPLVASLSSGQAAVVAILLTGLNALLMVFFPGLEWQKSWIFDACLLMLFTNLFLVLLRYKGANRIRFYLNHAGLFVFVAALEPPDLLVWINLFAFGGLEATFLWPLLLGLYWRRANAAGALFSIITGLGCFFALSLLKPAMHGIHAIVPTALAALLAFLLGNLLDKPRPQPGPKS